MSGIGNLEDLQDRRRRGKEDAAAGGLQVD
jgi:hypothetical protein